MEVNRVGVEGVKWIEGRQEWKSGRMKSDRRRFEGVRGGER